MPILLECLSHTPLHGYFDPSPDVVMEVERVNAASRERVRAFDPELVVVFAPDHYNGFFYDMMPPFCIGAAATAIGDYKSLAGELPIDADLAKRMADSVLAAEVDVSISYRMLVDHGAAQALEQVTGGLDSYPVVPVFINSVAPPMATLKRSRLLGKAIGEFLKQTGKRVLILGSGGISHEPPVPELAGASLEIAERLIHTGRNLTPEQRNARQERVINAAKAFTAGDAPNMRALNPEWDLAFLNRLQNDLMAVDRMSNEEITRDGGKSAHEIRTWVAAFGALSAFGAYEAQLDFYQPIPEWIAGFACMHAKPLN
ncbi:3-carboxyethylcatechol 2,3-dioxygenase [Paraburkholderia sp. CNPSo 3155]|uniref:3-carboxyethylcatechol 2,3-dioxygenase n=1 Tax=Paraburkholderia atlantica TaxID=2654982 RepID=UPI00128AE5ED|nr:3-carboxyethylcatechol 2,3-dioxygenase [Paraburkholderia atlantica]MPW05322.1 3-carboxyethylcatechol 2,3-dioxygenase [Paraburkholderia atlantica]NUY30868.1 3-carboxyethylcatechol 2,3-dioxygenase [Paraburkholderia atlantica]